MNEVLQPGVLETPKKRMKVRPVDIIFFAVIIVIVVVLAVTLVSKLSLKKTVADARIVTDKAITAVEKTNGTAARDLGSSKFKSSYSADTLTDQFKNIQLVTSSGTPSVDHQTVYNGTKGSGKTVFVIYKFPPKLAKQAFYVRMAVNNKDGSWQLVNISGSADESKLIVD